MAQSIRTNNKKMIDDANKKWEEIEKWMKKTLKIGNTDIPPNQMEIMLYRKCNGEEFQSNYENLRKLNIMKLPN